jgi:vancomycin permeability regulator SanA
MRRVFVTSLTIIFATATPVLAAEYWVSQDPQTKHCTIVATMPDGKTQVMIGASSYPTREEAKTAKNAAKEAGQCVSMSKPE